MKFKALTVFLEKLKQVKENMEVYTNATVVKELITSQTEVKVYPFDQHVPKSKGVDLFLFNDHFLQSQQDCLREDKVSLQESTVF